MFEVGRLVARIQLDGAQVFGRDVGNLKKEFQGLDDTGKKATGDLGKGLAVVGVGIAALAGLAVTKFASFDKAMSKVSATTGAASDTMDRLRKAAIEAGGATVFSAEEAASAQVELAKAGVDTADILGGALTGALALAAAGEIGVADAAETAATAMTQFRLSGKDVPHIADLLAAAAGKAQGGVADMGMALKQSGLVASQMGLSIEETTGTLAAFASAGLIGSDAGTSFKTMLLSLASPSKESAALMKDYNIQAYDAQGNFVGMTELAHQLKTAFVGKTQAERDSTLATIFGSDAIRAANVLYVQGATGIDKWINKTNDAGYAARQAAEQQNNLAGDIEKLGGAIDSALITSGSGANEVLRQMVQNVTGMIDAYSSLPDWLQQTGAGFVVVAGVVALAGAAFLLGVPKIVAFRVAMQTLNTQIPALKGNLGAAASFLTGPWGVALAAGAVGVQLLGEWIQSLKADSTEMIDGLTRATSAADIFKVATKGQNVGWLQDVKSDVGDLSAVLRAADDQSKNVFARFTGSQHFGAFDTLKDIGKELGTLAGVDLPSAQRAFALLADETDGSKLELNALLDQMEPYKAELANQAALLGINVDEMSDAEAQTVLLALAQGQAKGASEQQARGLSELEGAASEAEGQIEDLADTIRNFGSAQFDVNSTTRAFEQAIDDVASGLERQKADYEAANGSLNGFKASLDLGTQAGRDNSAALDDIASGTLDLAAATFTQTGSQEKANAKIMEGRSALIKALGQFGVTGAAAEKYADDLGLIPSNVYTAAKLTGVENARAILDNLSRNRTAIITAQIKQTGAAPGAVKAAYNEAGGNVKFYAGGGENRAPQFAKAGDWRVWAEPETQGEWYFPENPMHRTVGVENARRMLSGWGYDVVKAGTGRETGGHGADGSTATSMSRGGDFIVNLHNPVSRDPVKEVRDFGELFNSEGLVP